MGKWDVLRGYRENQEESVSEEKKGLPQPALETVRGEGQEISLPTDFEELLKLLQQEWYEIKRGKHTAICGKEQKRFIRFRSLGEDYTEENLKKIIAGEKELPEKKEKVSDQKVVKSEKRKFDLVVDI